MPYGKRPGHPTERQQRFIDAYLGGSDTAAAARAAGYGPSTVRRNASRLLLVPTVAAAVRHGLDARAERTRIAADRIVLELARVAFSDFTRIADWSAEKGWTLRPPDELSEADRAAIARVTGRDGDFRIALHDKIRALDTLGKYFKLWGKHADKFATPGVGTSREVAPGTDIRTPALTRARAALKSRIEAIIRERDDAELAVKLREEDEWAARWKEAFGREDYSLGAEPGGGGGGGAAPAPG